MFKVAKLEKVNNEIVSIDFVAIQNYANEKKESFKNLSFDIYGDFY